LAQNSPSAAVEDLKAIFNRLNVDRAHVVGQSMGGWAAMGFALKYPERVKSLVLADTLGGIYTDKASEHFDAYIRETMTAPSPDELPISKHPAIGGQLSASDPEKAFLYRQIGGLGGPAPRNAGLQLRQTSYPLEAVRALNIPVLFVVGQHDPIFPPDVIRSVAAEVSASLVVELPDSGHSPYFETPEAWNEAVDAFLSGVAE
jgi:2-succinyl-6-hydroxy-2,4-cyclohexadiene-1-carboxylate synthase